MTTKEEYIAHIRQLVSESKLKEAIRTLREMAEKFSLPDVEDEAIMMEGRLIANDKAVRINTLSADEVRVENSKLAYAVLKICQDLEPAATLRPISSAKERGRIVHNIPPQMQVQEERFCSVRIAKDDAILLENFELPPANKPESLDISRRMEVSIVDPSGGQVFQIRRISEYAEQEVLLDRFTEWDFGITPLKSGNHQLFLYAYFIDRVDGKETRRAISFKRSIQIVTEPLPHAGMVWQPTEVVVGQAAEMDVLSPPPHEHSPKDIEVSPSPTHTGSTGHWEYPKPEDVVAPTNESNRPLRRSYFLTLALLLLAGAAIAALSFWVYRRYFANPKQQTSEAVSDTVEGATNPATANVVTITPVLELGKPMQVDSVLINRKRVDWQYENEQQTAVVLPAQTAKTYRQYFAVYGSLGRCEIEGQPNADNARLVLPCKKTDATSSTDLPPRPGDNTRQPVSFAVVTPFGKPRIKLDGQAIEPSGTVTLNKAQISHTLKKSPGEYWLEVADPSNRYYCTSRSITVRAGSSVVLECYETATMTLRIPFWDIYADVLGQAAKRKDIIKLSMNGNLVKISGAQVRAVGDVNYLVITVDNMLVGQTYAVDLKIQNHSFYCQQQITGFTRQNSVFDLTQCDDPNIIK